MMVPFENLIDFFYNEFIMIRMQASKSYGSDISFKKNENKVYK